MTPWLIGLRRIRFWIIAILSLVIDTHKVYHADCDSPVPVPQSRPLSRNQESSKACYQKSPLKDHRSSSLLKESSHGISVEASLLMGSAIHIYTLFIEFFSRLSQNSKQVCRANMRVSTHRAGTCWSLRNLISKQHA